MTTGINTDYQEELVLLKQRADLLGIKYSNNIGLETLRAKVNEKLENQNLDNQVHLDKVALRKKIQEEQMKLIRIRLNVLNPAKSAWRGEIFTIANSVLGTVKKFVPYDPKFYENGYHVPYCIYKMLQDKTYLNIKVTKDPRTGREVPHTSFAKEFGIEVLPALTREELAELAKEQAAGNRIGD